MSSKAFLEFLRADGQKMTEAAVGALAKDEPSRTELSALQSIGMDVQLHLAGLLKLLRQSARSQAERPLPRKVDVVSELTHGVAIERQAGGQTRVVIAIEGEESEDATVLSDAWASLAQAISDHKQSAPEPSDPPGTSIETGPAAQPQNSSPPVPPGSGAWWNG